MPYAFSSYTPPRIGESRGMDVPISKWLDLKFDVGSGDTIYHSYLNFLDDTIGSAGFKTLSVGDLNTAYGIEGQLKFTEPMNERRAQFMRERKLEEMRRDFYLNSATHSAFSFQGVAGLVASMAGGTSNPIDLAVNFIPFVGEEKAAAGLAKMGLGDFGRMVGRGVVTRETLAGATRFPGFSASIINATLGNAAVEIPVAFQKYRDQANYGPEDFALNIAMGGVVGGGLHILGAGFKRAIGIGAEAFSKTDVRSQEAALKQNTADILNGRPMTGHKILENDPAMVHASAVFDEVKAREDAIKAVGVLPEEARARAIIETLNRKEASATDLLDLAKQGANMGGERGKILTRLIDRFNGGERTTAVLNNIADIFDVRYNPLAPTLQERYKQGLFFGPQEAEQHGVQSAFERAKKEIENIDSEIKRQDIFLESSLYSDDEKQIKARIKKLQRRRALLEGDISSNEHLLKEVGGPLSRDEVSAHYKEQIESGKLFDREAASATAKTLASVAEEKRQQKIQSLIDEARVKHETAAGIPTDPQSLVEIKEGQKPGQIADDKTIAEASKRAESSEASVSMLKDDLKDIEQSLVSSIPKVENESKAQSAFRELVEKEIAKESPDISKAFEAAANCLMGIK